jgi:hypothetical protein
VCRGRCYQLLRLRLFWRRSWLRSWLRSRLFRLLSRRRFRRCPGAAPGSSGSAPGAARHHAHPHQSSAATTRATRTRRAAIRGRAAIAPESACFTACSFTLAVVRHRYSHPYLARCAWCKSSTAACVRAPGTICAVPRLVVDACRMRRLRSSRTRPCSRVPVPRGRHQPGPVLASRGAPAFPRSQPTRPRLLPLGATWRSQAQSPPTWLAVSPTGPGSSRFAPHGAPSRVTNRPRLVLPLG